MNRNSRLFQPLMNLRRAVIESAVGSPARQGAAMSLARRDAEATKRVAASKYRLALDTRDSASLIQLGHRRTLFILGSGASINTLTDEHWEEITAGMSVGVNSWPLHPFIPTIYSFESQESAEYEHEAQVLRSVLARRLETGHQPVMLHLRPHASTRPDWEILPPPGWDGRLFYYGRTTLATHRLRNLERDLKALIGAHRSGALPPEILLDSGGSVGRMVSLGIFLGFERVVLVGVDLGGNEYFFEDDPRYLSNLGIESYNPWKSRTEQHETQQRTNRSFVATEFLGSLAAVSRDLGGPEIFVAGKKSLLSGVVPQFKWGSELPGK
jgi:hypothetical protein